MYAEKFTDSGFGQIAPVWDLAWKLDSPRLIDDLTYQVMNDLDMYFSTRGLTYLSGQRKLLQIAAHAILGDAGNPPAVIPLLPGLGKSTLLRALLTVLSRQLAADTEYAQKLGGMLIVVGKTAEAYELQDAVSQTSRTPILILLHARYERFCSDLSSFRTWITEDGQLRQRSLLIVDEAPELSEENRISLSLISDFEAKLSRLG